MDIIDKNDYEIIKTNLTLFAEEKNYFINDLLKHPISCSLFLNKTTIYSYDKSDRLFASLNKYYDILTGDMDFLKRSRDGGLGAIPKKFYNFYKT